MIAGTLGNVFGSAVAYGIRYFLGRPVIVRFGRFVGITEEKLNVADQKFARYRDTIVLFGKFIAGIRVLIPYLAGINKMPFLLFSLYNTVSAVVWAAFFIVIGRYIEVAWSHYHKVVHQFLLPAIILVLVVFGLLLAKKLHGRQRRKLQK